MWAAPAALAEARVLAVVGLGHRPVLAPAQAVERPAHRVRLPLLARLPGALAQPDSLFPLLVTIEPPQAGGLAFHRTVRVEVHTHALVYSAGSNYRLFKAPLGGSFKDITDDVAPGSVRATRRTSAIEATSKWVTPESHSTRSRSDDGFALTAYMVVPGNRSMKKRAARRAACGRTSVTGSTGESA